MSLDWVTDEESYSQPPPTPPAPRPGRGRRWGWLAVAFFVSHPVEAHRKPQTPVVMSRSATPNMNRQARA